MTASLVYECLITAERVHLSYSMETSEIFIASEQEQTRKERREPARERKKVWSPREQRHCIRGETNVRLGRELRRIFPQAGMMYEQAWPASPPPTPLRRARKEMMHSR